MSRNQKLTKEEKSYIAGFLDGDGSIFAQIVKGKDYKYGFRIRVSIGFYQRKDKYWFLLKLKKLLKYGTTRIRKDNMAEYVITGSGPVEQTLLVLKEFVVLKKKNVNLVLKILEKKRNINSKQEFLELCQLVDSVAELNYSKKRKLTANLVSEYFKNPSFRSDSNKFQDSNL